MSKEKFIRAMVFSLFLCAMAHADTDVITFEGVAPPGGHFVFPSPTPYIEKGFEFIGVNDFRVISNTWPGLGIDNGTDHGFIQNPPDFTITRPGGRQFTLLCIDAGQSFGAGPGTLTITGNLAGGGTVVSAFPTQTNIFNSHNLPTTFSNLTSVDFDNDSNFLAIDNVCLVKRSALIGDFVTAMLPTQFGGADFDSGNTHIVGDTVEFMDRYNNGLQGIDLDISAKGFTFSFFNNHPTSSFNLGLLGLELTSLDLVGELLNPIIGVVLEPGSNFPAGTFDDVTIGADSIVFDLSSPNLVVPAQTTLSAAFKIQATSNKFLEDGFEDPEL